LKAFSAAGGGAVCRQEGDGTGKKLAPEHHPVFLISQ
jgi:hypothetical protein